MPCELFKLPGGVVGVVCYTSYAQQIDDAEARRKRGERQAYCFECDKWVWPGQCSHVGQKCLTMRALRKVVKQVKKEVSHLYPSQEAQYRRAIRKGGVR